MRLTSIARIVLASIIVSQSFSAGAQDVRPSFSEFLDSIRNDALARGIRAEIVDQALSNIDEPLPIVIERDRAQAETVLSLEKYLSRRLTSRRITTGREMLGRNSELLESVAERYDVPPSIVVAIWGAESNYGQLTGIRPTIAALATLAWDPRRSAFFRGELFDALQILERGDIDLPAMKGSWAGAMGQVQFMPSSYLQFAEDFDGDGRKDIWSTRADVFASISNYLVAHGWSANEAWGREVKASPDVARRITNEIARRDGTCQATRDMTMALPLKQWRKLGVRSMSGQPLPATDTEASLVSGTTRHFLVYRNYDALLAYNCANSYALGVALLADRISSPASRISPAGSSNSSGKARKTPSRR